MSSFIALMFITFFSIVTHSHIIYIYFPYIYTFIEYSVVLTFNIIEWRHTDSASHLPSCLPSIVVLLMVIIVVIFYWHQQLHYHGALLICRKRHDCRPNRIVCCWSVFAYWILLILFLTDRCICAIPIRNKLYNNAEI